MSYHVLARKWRPQTFTDLVGQSHVVKALTYALSHQQVHHAYLFTGTRGVGKTSIARIFAKSLNCETNGVSPNPCGKCESCIEIKAGKFVDLIEVDAASRTGVEETRELIESIAYLPSKGRYKVYLIDEVHMFSKSSFNALLKTLEEPPEYVKFILATTDPEKLPITILSRCLQFNLKSLTPAQITQHLVNICESEDIEYDTQALELLASAGDGSMRDTLSMTDQALAYGQGNLHLAAVTEILGTIHPTDIEAILFAVATNNPTQLKQALQRLDDYEIDARALLIEIMRRLQQMAWAKEGIIDTLSPTLHSTIADIPKELIHLWYDIAEKALPNLAIAGEPRRAVEMILLRMLAFIPQNWIARHRTPLSTAHISQEQISQENNDTKSTDNKPKTALTQKVTVESETVEITEEAEVISHSHPQELVKKAQEPMPTQEQGQGQGQKIHTVQATTIQATDSFEEAEQQFQNIAEPINDAIAEVTDTPTIANNTSYNDDTVAELQHSEDTSSWHLSTETNDDPTPDFESLKKMMTSGRNIAPPKVNKADTQAQLVQDTQSPENNNKEIIEQPTKNNDNLNNVDNIDNLDNLIKNFDWYTTFKALNLGQYTANFASLGILRITKAETGDYLQAILDLSPKHEVLITVESVEDLRLGLENYFNAPINLQTHITEVNEETPNERDAKALKNKQTNLLQTFQNESITQQVMSQLDGRIIDKTVKAKKQ